MSRVAMVQLRDLCIGHILNVSCNQHVRPAAITNPEAALQSISPPSTSHHLPYGPVNFGGGPIPFALFNESMTPAGRICMSVATLII